MPSDEIDVDVRPFWQRQEGREERYGVDRLYTRIPRDGASAFIGVKGLTVEFFSGPIQHTEPEITCAESPEEAEAAIETAMDEFNDLHLADYTGKEEA